MEGHGETLEETRERVQLPLKQTLAVLGTPEEMRGWLLHLAHGAYKRDVIFDIAEQAFLVHVEDIVQALRQSETHYRVESVSET